MLIRLGYDIQFDIGTGADRDAALGASVAARDLREPDRVTVDGSGPSRISRQLWQHLHPARGPPGHAAADEFHLIQDSGPPDP